MDFLGETPGKLCLKWVYFPPIQALWVSCVSPSYSGGENKYS